jgi:uncharacterized protein (TIGR02246 family)
MSTSPLVSAAALAAVVAACAPRTVAPPRPDENAIRTALTAQLAKITQVANTRDTAGFGDLFTQDATWIGSDASIFTGRASIDSMGKAAMGSYESMTMRPFVIDKLVVVSDSEAVAFTRANYTMKLKGKKPENRVNPFADLWKKGPDGVWRIAYEINADGPAAPEAPPKH